MGNWCEERTTGTSAGVSSLGVFLAVVGLSACFDYAILIPASALAILPSITSIGVSKQQELSVDIIPECWVLHTLLKCCSVGEMDYWLI